MVTATTQKAPDALRTISEAAEELGVPQHVLRFWEERFSQLRPMKRAGGRRYYRPEDMAMLKRIQTLLHVEGYTIKGVQKMMKERGKADFMDLPTAAPKAKPSASTPAQQAAAAQTVAKGAAATSAGSVCTLAGQDRAVLESALSDLKSLRAKLSA